jgi:hypothetical protein
MSREEYVPFVHALAADAKAVSDAELTTLFEGSWRERRTAAWLAAVSRRDHFRERLGALLESEVCCAGGAYRVAPASFGTAGDADLLAACLDRYLRRPDLAYDQPTAMGALAYTDSVLHAERAGRLLQGGGLWRQWFQDAPHMHGDDGISVRVGVRADGSKELVALEDGCRESAESWAGLMRDCGRRGMRAPVLAVGDGALGFWKALAEVFPETREQRCWVHKTANVLDAMPKSAQPGAKKAIQDIYDAEDSGHAEAAIRTVAKLYGAKFPKPVKKITDDQEELLAFYDFPAEHWIHLRTTNPIESTFSTVRLRTRVTRGAGARAAALAMVLKLVESAQVRRRAVNAPHLVALVRAGARFERGQLAEAVAA